MPARTAKFATSSVTFSSDGFTLVAAELRSRVRVWSLRGVPCRVSEFETTLQALRLVLSRDGSRLVTVDFDAGILACFDTEGGAVLWSHRCRRPSRLLMSQVPHGSVEELTCFCESGEALHVQMNNPEVVHRVKTDLLGSWPLNSDIELLESTSRCVLLADRRNGASESPASLFDGASVVSAAFDGAGLLAVSLVAKGTHLLDLSKPEHCQPVGLVRLPAGHFLPRLHFVAPGQLNAIERTFDSVEARLVQVELSSGLGTREVANLGPQHTLGVAFSPTGLLATADGMIRDGADGRVLFSVGEW